jgi:glycosyltransferase involved in cell wall biosynthesis
MILLEAMSQGLPLIASAVGGVPEIIRDGESGLLVPPGDGEKLADALEILTKNELLRWKMGKAGQKIVEEKFTLIQQAGQLKALLTDTIGLGKA